MHAALYRGGVEWVGWYGGGGCRIFRVVDFPSWWSSILEPFLMEPFLLEWLKLCTANEGPVRIQYKCLVPIYLLPEMKLLFSKQNYYVLSPSSNTHISVRDLYISRIGLPILLQGNKLTILEIYKSLTDTCMNVAIGTEAAQFPEKEYLNGIFVAVWSLFFFSSDWNCGLPGWCSSSPWCWWRVPGTCPWGCGGGSPPSPRPRHGTSFLYRHHIIWNYKL